MCSTYNGSQRIVLSHIACQAVSQSLCQLNGQVNFPSVCLLTYVYDLVIISLISLTQHLSELYKALCCVGSLFYHYIWVFF